MYAPVAAVPGTSQAPWYEPSPLPLSLLSERSQLRSLMRWQIFRNGWLFSSRRGQRIRLASRSLRSTGHNCNRCGCGARVSLIYSLQVKSNLQYTVHVDQEIFMLNVSESSLLEVLLYYKLKTSRFCTISFLHFHSKNIIPAILFAAVLLYI